MGQGSLTGSRDMIPEKFIKIKRFLRFQVVSIGGTLVNMGVFWLLYQRLDLPWPIASACAIELAIIHNFTWHYFRTWKDRIKKHGIRDYFRRLVHYNAVTASIDFVVNMGILGTLLKYTDIHPLLANFIGMAAGPPFKFLANEFFIFRHKLLHPHQENPPNNQSQP
ncbi:GtrA family protein [bacterium]|nr:GtrA family protein [bacterium]